MNFFGIGTDIVSIDRVKKSLKNKNFLKRIFNEKEIFKCKKIVKSTNCFAKRFAAKEAFKRIWYWDSKITNLMNNCS